jgi:hypothetical protein
VPCCYKCASAAATLPAYIICVPAAALSTNQQKL